jgi:ankyrin repeat protein
MPIRPLPNDPSLQHLRKQAKRLLRAVRTRDPEALVQLKEFHPRPDDAMSRCTLADAQLTIARSYGFASWAKLKLHLADIEPLVWTAPPPPDPASPVDVLLRLACLTYAGWHRSNPSRALRLLTESPGLAHTSVYAAAAVGDVDTVRAFLDRDRAAVNAKGGPLRWEPLLYACYSRIGIADPRRSTIPVARLLLARGADPNAGFLYDGHYAFTALTGAFGRGEDWDNQPPHPECDALARVLLEAGADPNDSQALYNRHFHADDEHLRLLLAYGLGRDKGGPWLPRLHNATLTPARLLCEELWSAAKKNLRARVELLVGHGADVNAPGLRNGRTPYEEALRAGNDAIAEYLIEHGARKIDLDPLETFALSCIAGRREEVQRRLAADPTLLEQLGHRGQVDLLHRALETRSREGLRLIVDLGVDINGMVPGTGLDRSVLHSAAGWGGLDMVTFLLGLGADPSLPDPTYHARPIGWALHSDQGEVIDYLLQFASIFDAVQCGGVERAAALLDEDPSLANARDEWSNPVVFYLNPERRLPDMIRLLLARGADINATNGEGRTLLDRALSQGWTDVAAVVRAHGGRTSST